MTGKANGFCLIRMPDDPGQPRTGFAGLAGQPVAMDPDFRQMDGRSLQDCLREMRAALAAIRSRLNNLESGGRLTPLQRLEETRGARRPASSKTGGRTASPRRGRQ
jgi:hypothetical protein